MPTAFLIAGLTVTLLGVLLIVTAKFERPATGNGNTEALNIAEIIDKFNNLLDKLEKQYRIGVVIIATGLSLAGIGAYLEGR